jgi:hypothetical protein
MNDADSVGGPSAASRRGPGGVSGTTIAGRLPGGGETGRGGTRFRTIFGAGFFFAGSELFVGAGFFAAALRAAAFFFGAAFLFAAFLFTAMSGAPPRDYPEK